MNIPSQWTFQNESVAENFDSHVRSQLPWYELATNAIKQIVRHYIPVGGLVYDIGAATGNISKALKEILEDRRSSIISIEPSSEMVKKWNGIGDLLHASAQDVVYEDFDVAICFLTLMFIPVGERKSLIKKLMASCKRGGAVIVFEKMIPPNGYLGTITQRLCLSGKYFSGVSADDIIKKELSLIGVQRPVYESDLPEGGFLWFKHGDFCGWIFESVK